MFRIILLIMLSPLVWAQQQNPETVDINQLESGQLLFQQSGTAYYQPAVMLDNQAEINIKGLVANVKVIQKFRNDSEQWQHATYAFPLPDQAAVNFFKMTLAEREVIAEIKRKQDAVRIFEKAKNDGKKAALLQALRPNLFTTKVANIPPGESISVEIQYFQQVQVEFNEFKLDFPMAITPRYHPSTAEGSTHIPDDELLHFVENNQKNANLLHYIDLTVNVNAGSELSKIQSLNHSMMVKQQGVGDYELSLKDHPLDKDFQLIWQYQTAERPKAIQFTENYQGHSYGLLMVLPPAIEHNQPTENIPRELTLILDTSGSMAGNSMKQAKQAAKFALNSLKETDRFQIIEFDSDARQLFKNSVNATEENKQSAWRQIRLMEADGGTEISKAFTLAFDANNEESNYLQQLVFLTDGSVGNEAQLFQQIHQNIGNRRLFTVGLGSAPNRYFMSRAATIGRGSYHYINDANHLLQEMRRLFIKLTQPVLTDLQIELADNSVNLEFAPNPLPELYAGQPLFIAYKVAKQSQPVSAEINGVYQQGIWFHSVEDLALNTEQQIIAGGFDKPALATLWARKKITDLEQQYRLYHDEQAKEEMIELALKHALVTPFTSFVAVEKTLSRPQQNTAGNQKLSNNLPAGQRLPNTALNWQAPLIRHAIIAVFCLLGLLIIRRKSL